MTDPVRTDPAHDRSSDPAEPVAGRTHDEPTLWQEFFAQVRSVARTTSRLASLVLGPLWRLLCLVGRFLKRWRTPLVLIPLLVGLGYAALVGGRMLWGERTSDPVAGPDVTCWNGDRAPRSACPLPTGAAGLSWVFPSLGARGRECSEVDLAESAEPVARVDCTRRVLKTKVTISYVQRGSLDGATSYLDKRYPGIEPVRDAGGDRLVYRDAAPRRNKVFEATAAYRDYPYDVTVRAKKLRAANRALNRFVDFRPAVFVLVKPLEATESPAP